MNYTRNVCKVIALSTAHLAQVLCTVFEDSRLQLAVAGLYTGVEVTAQVTMVQQSTTGDHGVTVAICCLDVATYNSLTVYMYSIYFSYCC